MPIPDTPVLAVLGWFHRQSPAERANAALGLTGKIWHGSRMTTYDNSYSRFVAWTKVILPVVALGILSTLFLFPRNIDPSQSIPYAEVDVEELAQNQRIGAPNYAGVTEDGSAISITAKYARPDTENPKRINATELTTILEDANGGRIDMIAGDGIIDSEQQIISLRGGVQITTSTGFTIDTSAIVARLDETSIVSEGQITARGPLGLIDAGKMVLKTQKGANASHLLVFKGGVKMVYDPKTR